MPALRKLPEQARQRILKLAHLLVVADGRVSVREFLLFTILKRRLGPDAGRAVPVRYRAVKERAQDAALAFSSRWSRLSGCRSGPSMRSMPALCCYLTQTSSSLAPMQSSSMTYPPRSIT